MCGILRLAEELLESQKGLFHGIRYKVVYVAIMLGNFCNNVYHYSFFSHFA
jgi:hypothetical protein